MTRVVSSTCLLNAARLRAAAFVFWTGVALATTGMGVAGCAPRTSTAGVTPRDPASAGHIEPGPAAPHAPASAAGGSASSGAGPALDNHAGGARTTSTRNAAGSIGVLQRQLDTIFRAEDIADAAWGILVRSLRTGETIFALNPTTLLVPASSLKVVTLAAAAERLGWDYRFQTRVGTSAPIEDGVVRGDVVIRGVGDPSIVRGEGRWAPAFDALAAQLASGGITRIEGRLIGDDNAFEDRGYGVNWAWDDFSYDYSAPIGALQYHENIVELIITPGREGERARVEVLDPAAGLSVVSEVITGANGSPTSIDYERQPGEKSLRVVGRIAEDAGPQTRLTAVENPTLYFVRALRTALMAHGIEVTGDAVDIDDVASAPPRDSVAQAQTPRGAGPASSSLPAGPAHTLATIESPRLLDLGTRLMKVSQNLISETLFKQLGLVAAVGSAGEADKSPRTATASAGRDAVRDLMSTEWRLDPRQFVLWDGSGLSRRDYVSAALLVAVLTRMAENPKHKESFSSTLPIAGRDGSLEHRMKGTLAEGNVRAKTGSMSQVRSLSGYVNTADNEPLAFSIITNGFTAPSSRVDEAVDAAMVLLAGFKRSPGANPAR